MNSKKLVALLGARGHITTGVPLLEQVCSRYEVWGVSDKEPPWHSDLIAGTSQVPDLEAESFRQAISALMATRTVDGIMTWDESAVEGTAACAQAFGLRSVGPQGVRGCRDKALTREKLTAIGVPQPQWRRCMSEAEALTFARTLGFPVVIKPRGLVGSIGVSLVESEATLKRKFKEVSFIVRRGFGAFREGILIEEYLEGPEISVDGAVVDGHYTPLCVARKTVGFPPYFEELGHVVSSTDPLLRDPELLDILQRAHAAIELENGMTHTELKLSPRGMTVVEINGRIGGDLIPRLAELACGLKLGLIGAQVAAGDPADLELPRGAARTASITFRYPERNLKVKSITLPEPVRSPEIEGYCSAMARVGEFIGLPPAKYRGRVGYAIAVGNDARAATELSEALALQIQVTAE